jgi:hypothetical protein
MPLIALDTLTEKRNASHPTSTNVTTADKASRPNKSELCSPELNALDMLQYESVQISATDTPPQIKLPASIFD